MVWKKSEANQIGRHGKRMRVLSVLYSYPPTFSGATKFWLRLMPRLLARGVHVDVLYRKNDGEIVLQRHEGEGLSIDEPPGLRRGTHLGTTFTILKGIWLHRNEYSCVIFNGAPDSMFAALFVKSFMPLRIAYRMTMLGEDDPPAIRKIGRLGWLRALLLRRIDVAICTNPAMAEGSRDAGLDANQVVTIAQGTDVEAFSPATAEQRRAIRERECWPQNAKIVLFCGAIVFRKGVDLLMKAWPQVVERHPNTMLVLVGPDGDNHDDPGNDFRRSVDQACLNPPFRGTIRLLGYKDNVRELLQAADVFVLPTRMEGTPNVLLEAMATSLPIIVSDLPGVSGVFVRNESEAFVIPQDDWQRLGDCLTRLIGEDELAKTFAERARQRVVENFSLDSVADKYSGVFKRMPS